MKQRTKHSPSIALVLSSGGARGLAHIGVIHELIDRGYKIRAIAGSSMGALVGGLYAVGKLEEYEQWIMGFDKLDILRMIDFTLSDEGFIKGERVFEQMRKLEMIPDIRIEELPLPFTAVAVDILRNKERVFTSGSLLHAIRASIAIPLVFTPVHEEGGILVDGGVLSPLPLDYVERKPGDLLVAVDLNAPIPYSPPSLPKEHSSTNQRFRALFKKWDEMFGHRSPFRLKEEVSNDEKIGYFDLIMRSVQLMQHRLTTYALTRTPPDVLIQISKDCATVFEFYRAKELIEYGRAVCSEVLNQFEASH
ncbi:MAG: patatin-like phospholipase family protein [Spirochaetes bacterium]|nr:patatin-like phospholipase family protein [Spirochaetota bacterium]